MRSLTDPARAKERRIVIAQTPKVDTRHLLADELAGRFPDARGRFGPFGGRYVPETLIPALERLESGMRQHLHTAEFQAELARELKIVGWPAHRTHVCRAALEELGRRNLAEA